MNIIEALRAAEAPIWLPSNVKYLTITGSVAYGCSTDMSDKDIYGFAVPQKREIYGDGGEIVGFDVPIARFQEWQKHGFQCGETTYDFTVFSIVKYFKLLAGGNPNCLDTLFTPPDCKIYETSASKLLVDNRKLFLSKEMTVKFLGYCQSQAQKMNNKEPVEGSKRWEDIQKNSYSTKYACHLVRLLLECEQLLLTGDLDMRSNASLLSDIRAGEWTKDEILKWFAKKEVELKDIRSRSALPEKPDMVAIRKLLVSCLEGEA